MANLQIKNQKTMAEVSLYLDKRTTKKDGSYPVILIVCHDRKNKRYDMDKKSH